MSSDAIEAIAFFFGLSATAWAAAYAWAKWLKHRFDEERALPSADVGRLARLESAVEALSVELERLGEAQRYAVKLLDERLPRAVSAGRSGQPAEGGRIVTPY
jgi:hypothetical protein